MDVIKFKSFKTNELTALTPEMDSDQTAVALPLITSAVFLIAENWSK
jgi:hypothetical protein